MSFGKHKRLRFLTIKPTMWEDIVAEDKEFENYIRKENQKNLPTFECASGYINRELFPCLVPAFESVCAASLKNGVLAHPARFINFIDALAEVLHNTNPAQVDRKGKWMSIHLIYKNQDRPYYPYFWFLSPAEAAVIIQALVRGFLIRRKFDLQAIKVCKLPAYMNDLTKEERRKVQENNGKLQQCYIALKEEIKNMHH